MKATERSEGDKATTRPSAAREGTIKATEQSEGDKATTERSEGGHGDNDGAQRGR